jgi:multidrug efflux pump subunit AcrA (membrane-fusion protein)
MPNVPTKKRSFKKAIYIGIFVIIVAGAAWYFFFNKASTTTEYVLQPVQRSSIKVTVTGTGQVSALQQIDVKPEIANSTSNTKIKTIKVAVGQAVKAGDVVATLDDSTAQSNLRQAAASLASAEASYQQVLSGATVSTVKLSQLSVASAQSNYDQAKTDLVQTQQSIAATLAQTKKTYNDLVNNPSTTSDGQAITDAQTNLTNTQTNNQQSVDNNKKALTLSLGNQIVTAQTVLDTLKTQRSGYNFDNNLKIVFSAENPNYSTQLDSDYDRALALLPAAQTAVQTATANNSDTNLSAAITNLTNLFNALISASNDSYSAFKATIIGNNLNQSELDSYKATAVSQINQLNSALTSLQNNTQSWQNAQLAYSTGLTNSQASVAQAQLNYTNDVQKAQDALTNAQLSSNSQLTAAQQKVTNAAQSLANAKEQYVQTVTPADAQSVAQAKANLTQAQVNYQNAQSDLTKTIVTSPISGKVAAMNVHVGDDANSSTVLATVITDQKIVAIPLNEVDAAKVQVGQPADITFSALPDLDLTGQVSEVDEIGTASAGVVNYNVDVSFSSQDVRIKPGMSSSIIITVQEKDNILVIPTTAIKTRGSLSYVQMISDPVVVALKNSGASGSNTFSVNNNQSSTPTNTYQRVKTQTVTSVNGPVDKYIEIGIANDTQTEVVSGLNEGDQIIIRTIASSSTATKTATASSSAGRSYGGGGGFGGGGGGGVGALMGH